MAAQQASHVDGDDEELTSCVAVLFAELVAENAVKFVRLGEKSAIHAVMEPLIFT